MPTLRTGAPSLSPSQGTCGVRECPPRNPTLDRRGKSANWLPKHGRPGERSRDRDGGADLEHLKYTEDQTWSNISFARNHFSRSLVLLLFTIPLQLTFDFPDCATG